MFYASSYIFRSIRAGSSNSSTQTSDLYPVGIINILTETGRYAVGKTQSHLHKTKEALSLMLSQLCTQKERTLWKFSKEILAEHVQTDVFCRHITFSNLINVSKKQNKRRG